MRTLITNDDGIDAAGLVPLARAALDAGLDVVVAAPAVQSSGTSASIIAEEADGRIAIERRELDGLEGISAFAVRGGPGLISLIAARGAFGDPAELVLSGINHGANVGRAILHSGTVGAALTGGLHGARAMAVSLDVGLHPDSFHWRTAALAVGDLLAPLLQHPTGTVINVNVPNSTASHGIREAALAPFGIVQTTLSEADEHFVRLAVEDMPNDPQPGTDAALLAEGWTTVTALDSVSALPFRLDGAQSSEGPAVTSPSTVSPDSAGSGTR